MKKDGFTLIELLAVIVILGIVVAIAIPGINSVINNSRKKALDHEAKIIQSAAIRKIVGDPNYDFSHINKDNLAQHLETNGTKFDYIGIHNNNGKVTVTLTKDGYTTTTSNDEEITDAKIYGLRIDFDTGTYTRLDDASTLTAAVGTDTLNPTNKFDDADIYKDIKDVVEDNNHFVSIPKFYIKKTVNGNIEEIRISKKKHDNDYYLPNVFVNHDTGTERGRVLIGKYTSGLESGKLLSKPGLMPRVSADINTMRNETKANGSGYQLIDIHAIDVIQTLFSIEFATLDSQSVMAGYTDGSNSSAIVSGQTDAVQSKSGSITSNTTGKFAMKYRGIENIYGNVYQFVDGVNIKDRVAYVSTKPENYQSDKFDGDYQPLGYTNGTSGDYVTRMGYDSTKPYANFPISSAAIGSSLYKDYYYQNPGNRVALFGGRWNYSTYAGLSIWRLNLASSSSLTAVGSRILKTAS